MAWKVIWTKSAAIGRRIILEYWIERTGDHKYSQKIAHSIDIRIKYLKSFPKIGKVTDIPEVRTTACGHFSLYYLIKDENIVILAMRDTRQDPIAIFDQIIEEKNKLK